MLRRKRWPRRSDRKRIDPSEVTEKRTEKRTSRQDKRKIRKEKRRAFFLALSSNVKWIMIAAAVIAVLLFAKFGIPSLLTTGV